MIRLVIALFVAGLVAAAPDAREDLKSPDPKRRARAAEELGRQKDVASIELLRPLLNDPDRDVKVETVAALVSIGTQRSLEPLVEATRDADPAVQILALDGLVNFYYPGYVQTGWTAALKKLGSGMKNRIAEPSPLVIDSYLTVAPEVVQALGRVIVGGTSMESRALAARSAGILRARPAAPQLIETLKSKDTAVILESLRALEKIGDRSVGPALTFLLRDLHEPVQIAAIETAGQLQNREAIPVLRDLLKTGAKTGARRAALVTLAKLPDASLQDLFRSYLDDRDRHMRGAAAEGLGRLGLAEDRPRLERVFESERNQSARLSMAFALIRLGDHSRLPYLLDALNSTFHRGEARPFLVELARDPKLIEALYGPLRTGSNDQKKNLAQVMASSGGPDCLPHLEALTHDPDPEVAQEAIRAVKSLKTRL